MEVFFSIVVVVFLLFMVGLFCIYLYERSLEKLFQVEKSYDYLRSNISKHSDLIHHIKGSFLEYQMRLNDETILSFNQAHIYGWGLKFEQNKGELIRKIYVSGDFQVTVSIYNKSSNEKIAGKSYTKWEFKNYDELKEVRELLFLTGQKIKEMKVSKKELSYEEAMTKYKIEEKNEELIAMLGEDGRELVESLKVKQKVKAG